MSKVNLEAEYQQYLHRVDLKEEDMGPEQQSETKRAFMGGCAQTLVMIADLNFRGTKQDVTDTIADMLEEVSLFFNGEVLKDRWDEL